MTIIVFALILLVLVLIHEFGHFIVAKKLGVKVEEFAFGFPPRLWSKKVGETEYSVNALPIGGYVKLYGEDQAGGGKVQLHQDVKVADEKRAFYAQKPSHRFAIGIAGVVMNAFLAAVLFYLYFFISGFKTDLQFLPNTNPHFFLANQVVNTQIIVGDVVKGSPADLAGIKSSAIITKVNGQKIESSDQFVNFVNTHKGEKIALSFENNNQQEETVTIVPRVNPPKNQGSLGIAFYGYSTLTILYEKPLQKIASGVIHPINLMIYNFQVLGGLVATSIKQKNAAPLGASVTGPVGIYSIVGSIVSIPSAKERTLDLLNLAGLLSISLAFFNVLPIPALDGGRLFFIVIEWVFGKKINPKIEGYINTAGMAVLLGLLLLVTYHDIVRQLSGNGF